MEILIRATDDTDALALVEFYHWLQGTRPVTRNATLSLRAEGTRTTMSGGDVIVLVTGVVSAVSAAVQAYAAWRGSRQSAPTLGITAGTTTIVVAGGTPEELAAILEAVAQIAAGEHE